MKKIILSVLVVFMALNLAMAQNNPENKPEITFEKITHDFGTIKEVDGPVSCTFKFKNTGNWPLVIIQKLTNQPYKNLSVTYSKEPFKPGAEGEVKVTYDVTGEKPGKFIKGFFLRTNTGDKLIYLKIEGDMIGKSSPEIPL